MLQRILSVSHQLKEVGFKNCCHEPDCTKRRREKVGEQECWAERGAAGGEREIAKEKR